MSYTNPEGGDVFLGRDMVARRDFSEKKSEEIDEEVQKILAGKYQEAKRLLLDNRDKLETIAELLLERETLNREQLELLLENRELPPLAPVEPGRPARPEGEAEGKEPQFSLGDTGIPDPEPMPG